jgi:DNA uptake protein ComE-like DNA-binding protein
MKWVNALSTSFCVSVLVVAVACRADSTKTGDTGTAVADTPLTTATAAGPVPAAAVTPTPATTGGMIDPNSATRADLTAIPGVSDSVAGALIVGRPYANMVAVDRVLAKYLSEQQRDSVYTRLWKPLDLNTATAEEILLIPGVGPRMRHEFEEYRPYKSIEQFRREIGKYVDKEEVARLERYVTIR